MDERIDILVVIDAETLVGQQLSQNREQPSRIDSGNTVYMIVKSAQAISGQAGHELDVAARPGDNIRWREMTLTLNSSFAVLFYKFKSTQNELITEPLPVVVQANFPNPSDDPPYQPVGQNIDGHFWQCTVRNPGRVTYNFDFMILNRDNEIQGYCTWDPFITIT